MLSAVDSADSALDSVCSSVDALLSSVSTVCISCWQLSIMLVLGGCGAVGVLDPVDFDEDGVVVVAGWLPSVLRYAMTCGQSALTS